MRVTDMPEAGPRVGTAGLHAAAAARSRVRRLPYQHRGDRAVAQAVGRAQSGDREAIRFLYAHYSGRIYGYVFSMIRDQSETEEVTQHVFLKLMSVIDKYEPRQVPFTSWLMRVARDVAIDHLRVQRPVPDQEAHEPLRLAAGSAGRRRWQLEQAVEVLSEERQRAIVQRNLVSVTADETATPSDHTQASIHDLHGGPRKVAERETIDDGDTPPARAAVS